jgi:hypothetical protein
MEREPETDAPKAAVSTTAKQAPAAEEELGFGDLVDLEFEEL